MENKRAQPVNDHSAECGSCHNDPGGFRYRMRSIIYCSTIIGLLLFRSFVLVADDGVSITHQPALATSGFVRVYHGAQLNLFRTTQFRLKNFNLDKQNKIASLYFDTTLSPVDVRTLNEQLKQQTGQPTIDSAIPISPYKVEVVLKDINDVVVGRKIVGGDAQIPIDEVWVANIGFNGDENAFKATEIIFTPTYKVNTSSENFAKIESISTAIDRLGETALGGKMGDVLIDKDFITRDAKQSLARAITNSVVIRSLNPSEAQRGRVQLTLTKFVDQLEDRTINEAALDAMDKLAIWTPGIGRIEVRPTIHDFDATKQDVSSAMTSKIQEIWAREHEKAESAGSFQEWYKRKYKEGSGSGSASADAGLAGILTADSDVSFSAEYKQSDEDSGKYAQQHAAYEKLKENKSLSNEQVANTRSYAEGVLKTFDSTAKKLSLTVWRDASFMKRRVVDDLELVVSPGAPIDLPFVSLISLQQVIPEPPTTIAERVRMLESKLGDMSWLQRSLSEQVRLDDEKLQQINMKTKYIRWDDDGTPYWKNDGGSFTRFEKDGRIVQWDKTGTMFRVVFDPKW